MKRVLTLIAALVIVTGFAAAGSHDGLLTPDHPLYDAKMAGEDGVESLAPNETEEAEAKVKHAEKRANETEQLVDENKTELANETAEAYAEEMQEVNDLGNRVSDLAQKQKIDELVAEATQHHADVLSTVYERVPEEAKAGVEKALNQSVKGFEKATDAMQNRGQSTDGLNMSEHIPSDVQNEAGINLSDVGSGQPDDVGGDAGSQSNDTGGGADNAPVN